MLDSKSLDAISRLKLALLIQAKKTPSELATGSRGKKVQKSDARINTLTPKIVEYNGSNHLVLTNDVIERTNYHNKRRWRDFYENGQNSESGSDSDGSDSEFSDDDNPFKKIRLSELLAPLYHPSELSTHPAILKTFKLGCLATLAAELIELIEGEQKTLNQLNKLLQVLDGEDWYYQLEENMELPAYDHGLDEDEKKEKEIGESQENGEKRENNHGELQENGDAKEEGEKNEDGNENVKQEDDRRITRNARLQAEPLVSDPFFALPKSLEFFEAQQRKQREESEDEDELVAILQEVINYLQVSIQRQHEYIKNLSTIRNALVKADKYKKDLLRWGREMGEKK